MSGTIAVTGATGFIGRALIRRLVSNNRQVRALLRPVSARKRPAYLAVDWIDGDLEDIGSLRRLVNGVEAIVHCAGTVRGINRTQFNQINVDGVARLVQAVCEQLPVPRFLLISSLAAREPQLSSYAASKRQGEKALAAKSDKLPWTVFRPSAVYGPGDRELLPVFRWIEKGIAPILGSDNNRLSLLYVDDLTEAIMHWLKYNKNQGCTYELHDGHPAGYSWRDVVDTVALLRGRTIVRIKVPLVLIKLLAGLNIVTAKICGYTPMLSPGKVRELQHPDWIGDNEALSNDTGWTPQISLAEGLKRTLGSIKD